MGKAKEYMTSLGEETGFDRWNEKTEEECLELLIASHKRIRGHFFYMLRDHIESSERISNRLEELIKVIDGK